MSEKIIRPDYNNSILQIPNSILKYCGIQPLHQTSGILDGYLRKEYDNVVFMLFDGMGSDCIEKNLDGNNSFFRANRKIDLTSVMLSTTTAATTSLVSAMSPMQHGWLGWGCYFEELGKLVNLFVNDDGEKSDGVSLADYYIADKFLHYTSVMDMINQSESQIEASYVSRFGNVKIEELHELFEKTKILCNDSTRRYIYTYWGEPDCIMHFGGCYHSKVQESIRDIEKRVQNLAASVQNTLFVVCADHGLIDSRMHAIEDYPDITACLRLPLAMEPRCLSLYIKDGMMNEFIKIFNSHFKNKFALYTKQEFIQSGFLGPGEPHKKSLDFIGDIVAVAIDDVGIWYRSASPENYRAMHAGMTAKEMLVPLIVFESEG